MVYIEATQKDNHNISENNKISYKLKDVKVDTAKANFDKDILRLSFDVINTLSSSFDCTINGMKFQSISEKAFVVIGDKKAFKEDLKALNGKWMNKYQGWMFSKRRKADVEALIKKITKSKNSNASKK